MRNLKKALCGIMTGMMIITAAPAAIPGTGIVTEVQAATIGTPKMVSVKAVGKSTVTVKWSAVKGAAGYRVMRKTNSGNWATLKDIAGASKVTYSDTKVSVGNKYTYTVKAYTKNKKSWSSYNKTGLSAVAGISTLKLNKTSVSVYEGSAYSLKINGAKVSAVWTSSNKAVATVSSKGRVVGKKAGTAKITAKLGGRSFVCTVTVKKKPVQVSTTVKNNYTTLINAVKSNGGKLTYVSGTSSSKFTTTITYSSSDSKLHISHINNIAKVNIYITGTKIDQIKVYCEEFNNKYVSTLDATTWNGSNLKFYNTRTNKPGSDDRQSMANTFTSITFDAVNKILQSNVNLTLKSLGFTRYNG